MLGSFGEALRGALKDKIHDRGDLEVFDLLCSLITQAPVESHECEGVLWALEVCNCKYHCAASYPPFAAAKQALLTRSRS